MRRTPVMTWRKLLEGDDRHTALREVIRGSAAHPANSKYRNVINGCHRTPLVAGNGDVSKRVRGGPGPEWLPGVNAATTVIATASRCGTAARAVLLNVTIAPARVTPDGSLIADVVGNERAALSGTFAASMERLVGVVSRS